MRTLSVNIDHIATLREARKESFPDPVQAAALVELGGADGVTVHLRGDRRHIKERDVELLRSTIRTHLTVEMAATAEMTRTAIRIRPDQVTLVPELRTEVTTSGGLDVVKRFAKLRPHAQRLKKAGIKLCVFVEPTESQIRAAAKLGADMVELNTDQYSKDKRHRSRLLVQMVEASSEARELGLRVHAGHGLDYLNVVPLLEMDVAEGFSIGFAIVARAVMVGLERAVAEMKSVLEVRS